MSATAFRTPPRPRRLQSSELFDNARNPSSFQQKGKISEMINPDGSVTVRRKIINSDGSISILQEEYSSLDRRILGASDAVNNGLPTVDDLPFLAPSTSGSSSSVSTIKTSPSRAAYLTSNHNGFTSEMRGDAGKHTGTNSSSEWPPVDRRRHRIIPIYDRDFGLKLDDVNPVNLALKMELAQAAPSIGVHLDETDTQPSGRDGESSSMSSMPVDDIHKFNLVQESRRPTNSIPFQQKYDAMSPPDPSLISVSTWGVPDADVSAMSGDSMGYPVLDTSTAFYESNEKSDSETEWSLLQEDSSAKQESSPKALRGNPPLPNRRGTSKRSQPGRMIRNGSDKTSDTSDSSPKDAETSLNHTTDETTTTFPSGVLDTSKVSDSSTQSDLVVVKQAAVLAEPRPTVRYYADPGVASGAADGREDLRDIGALFDAPSLTAHDEISEVSGDPQSEEIVFTVRKKSPEDKLGIFVGVREVSGKPQLVVSKVSRTGKFAESPVVEGDTVVSINGKSFLHSPSSDEALGKINRCRRRRNC